MHNRPPPMAQPIPCTDCTRTFSRRPDLERHHREVHQQRKYDCDYPGCGYSSTRKERTRKHIETKHPGWRTQILELNADNMMQNQGQANDSNSQASMQDYSSSFPVQSNQTYGDNPTSWYCTPEPVNSETCTTPLSHHQQTSYSSPNPSISPYQTTPSAGSSYGNDWEYGSGAPQEGNNWNSAGNGWQNGYGQNYP